MWWHLGRGEEKGRGPGYPKDGLAVGTGGEEGSTEGELHAAVGEGRGGGWGGGGERRGRPPS
jgi:hypothetical protein